jgi:hypothetical protein
MSSSLIVLGILFPLLFMHSGLMESHVKFKAFIYLFAKFIPSVSVLTVAISDFGIKIIEFHFNYEIGLWNYVAGISTAIMVISILYWFEEEFS